MLPVGTYTTRDARKWPCGVRCGSRCRGRPCAVCSSVYCCAAAAASHLTVCSPLPQEMVITSSPTCTGMVKPAGASSTDRAESAMRNCPETFPRCSSISQRLALPMNPSGSRKRAPLGAISTNGTLLTTPRKVAKRDDGARHVGGVDGRADAPVGCVSVRLCRRLPSSGEAVQPAGQYRIRGGVHHAAPRAGSDVFTGYGRASLPQLLSDPVRCSPATTAAASPWNSQSHAWPWGTCRPQDRRCCCAGGLGRLCAPCLAPHHRLRSQGAVPHPQVHDGHRVGV